MECVFCGPIEGSPQDLNEAIEMMVEHIRVLHPEHYGDGPERWPDGGLVVEDESLDPSDFVEEV